MLALSSRVRAATIVLTALAAGLAGAGGLVAGARWLMPASLAGPVAEGGWTDRSRAWFELDGVYPAELSADTGEPFSWTAGLAHLRSPGLSRSQAYDLTLDLSAWRPDDPVVRPVLTVYVDSVEAARLETTGGLQRVSVTIPPREAPGLQLTLHVSDTFVPGPHDARTLGATVTRVALTPASGAFRATAGAAGRAALAIALAALGLLLGGAGRRAAVLVVAGVTAGLVWLLLVDGALYGPYVDRLVWIGGGTAALGAVAAAAHRLWPARLVAELPEWPAAVSLVAGASMLTLAVVVHPLAIVGDAVFQVHRASQVVGGQYFFTSVTPNPFFEFPYAIALYVAALPFWAWFPSEMDQVRLLRGLSLGASALVGLGLYAVARRQWRDGRAALLCALVWPFAGAPLVALTNANLTNLFGQGVFGLAVTGVAWIAAGPRTAWGVAIATTAMLIVGFLSHFSTLSVGAPLVGVVGVALVAFGRDRVRRAGWWTLAMLAAALAVSWVVYYAHFTDVYRATFERAVTDVADVDAPTKMVAPPLQKLRNLLAGSSDDYGLVRLPLLLSALAGAVWLGRRRRREGLTLVLAGWALTWVGFTALGVLTPIHMRASLAAAPVFVALGACGLSAAAAHSRAGRLAAAVLTTAIVWDGVTLWRACLGV